MVKKSFTTRLEESARDTYRSLADRHDVSVAVLMEGLVYWLDGNDAALGNMPQEVRDLISKAAGCGSPQGDGEMEDIKARLLAIEKRLDAEG